ncbi:MAG TPA: hypothetical protein PLO61_06255 [Fimbriimonadaceae bacterium]|nr:hypothetical protein [Fimbriimonadaceae bacterium]HRJ33147.1 hypothetical protein [Fimbriimonadaceae bacterium]
MKYYVIAPDGSRYGPADEDTLTQWAAENRINPTTTLESEETGARMMASQAPGIIFTQPTGPSMAPPLGPQPGSQPRSPGPSVHQPYGTPGPGTPPNWSSSPNMSPYPRSAGSASQQGNNDFILAWVFFGVTFVGGCCPVLPGVGIFFANRAVAAEYPGAQLAKTLNIILFILSILGYAGYAALVGFAVAAGGFG